jgi:quercetin dioxygenase-like cupin family protein
MTNTSKLKNNKFFSGKFTDFPKTKGWFVGSFFDPNHPLNTDKVEVLYQKHQPGDTSKPHYHKQKVEILIFLTGKAKYQVNSQEVTLRSGDFLFVDVNNIIQGTFLKPSTIFAIHAPSFPTDKFIPNHLST